jgi:hypothetical protein
LTVSGLAPYAGGVRGAGVTGVADALSPDHDRHEPRLGRRSASDGLLGPRVGALGLRERVAAVGRVFPWLRRGLRERSGSGERRRSRASARPRGQVLARKRILGLERILGLAAEAILAWERVLTGEGIVAWERVLASERIPAREGALARE